MDPSARAAVVRIEIATDPFSFGSDLAVELASRSPWTSYEAEVARRLRTGATGTGFFVNEEGYLVTNAHVLLSGVRWAGLHFPRASWDSMTELLTSIRDVWVTVEVGQEQRSYLAEPVAIAESLDLAVLHVVRPPGDGTIFNSLMIGQSDSLAVGAPIRALGYPGYDFQGTDGKVLSLIHGSRVHEGMQFVSGSDPETGEETFIVSGTAPGPVGRFQHNAATGHGSSGGPIVDAKGHVVGIAYAVLSKRRPEADAPIAPSGLNLAIASNVLKDFLTRSAVAHREAPL